MVQLVSSGIYRHTFGDSFVELYGATVSADKELIGENAIQLPYGGYASRIHALEPTKKPIDDKQYMGFWSHDLHYKYALIGGMMSAHALLDAPEENFVPPSEFLLELYKVSAPLEIGTYGDTFSNSIKEVLEFCEDNHLPTTHFEKVSKIQSTPERARLRTLLDFIGIDYGIVVLAHERLETANYFR